MARKALAVSNVAGVLEPDGVLFGASVLGESGAHNWVARRVLHAFNRRGAFDNLEDSERLLRGMLGASFEQVEMSTVGSIARSSPLGTLGNSLGLDRSLDGWSD